MEDKVRRNIIIPTIVDEKLKREHNASAVIVEALAKHYAAKDTARQLVTLVERTGAQLENQTGALNDLALTVRKVARFMQSQGADIDV